MAIFRSPQNPIITPHDVKPFMEDSEVVGAFNNGVAVYDDEVILLLRVAERPVSEHPDVEMTVVYDPERDRIATKEFHKDDRRIDFKDSRMRITPWGKYLTSLSHFRVARSKDGINFEIEDRPALFPCTFFESFGIEDPRITQIGDVYYIDYVGVCEYGVTTCLASTKDFVNFQRHGVIFCPENKDVVIFPEKINGKYYALHRPVTPLFEKYHMWMAESENLINWGNHRYFMGFKEGMWDCSRGGAGAVPFKTDEGWMEIYHGVDADNRYSLGAVLMDHEQPWKIKARSVRPLLQPETEYEKNGFFGNVVFTCGVLNDKDTLKVYYGVSDDSVAYAEMPMTDVFDTFE